MALMNNEMGADEELNGCGLVLSAIFMEGLRKTAKQLG
jgi:hypothetical protein